MGKVASFSLPGIDMWFNSMDHPPPHLHARRKGEWEIRVFFLATTMTHLEHEVKWSTGPGPSRSTQRRLRELVAEHREGLLAEWEAKVDTGGDDA